MTPWQLTFKRQQSLLKGIMVVDQRSYSSLPPYCSGNNPRCLLSALALQKFAHQGWSNHSLISAQPPAASFSENISSLGNRSSVFSHMHISEKVSASLPREIKVVMRVTFRAQMYFMSLCAEALLLWKAIKHSQTLTQMVIFFILVALSNHSSNAILMRI